MYILWTDGSVGKKGIIVHLPPVDIERCLPAADVLFNNESAEHLQIAQHIEDIVTDLFGCFCFCDWG